MFLVVFPSAKLSYGQVVFDFLDILPFPSPEFGCTKGLTCYPTESLPKKKNVKLSIKKVLLTWRYGG
jgi:hypothetical protein